MLGLPGSDEAFTSEQLLAVLKTYEGIDAKNLKSSCIILCIRWCLFQKSG